MALPRVQIGTMLPTMFNPRKQLQLARFLEALGFQQIWLPDHLLFPEGGPSYDPWTTMSALAHITKKPSFGSAVTDPHRLHPALMAQKLATLDQLSRGRVILGLGSGEAMSLDPYGISWRERKVRKISEFISVVRGLLDSQEPFTFEGDFFQLRKACLAARPYKKRHIPIFMAALGPMMQKLAGKKADGWFPTLLPASEYGEYFRPVAESARKAGRDPDSIARVATVMAGINTDGALTIEELVERLRPMSGALVWPGVLKRLGMEFNPPPEAQSSYLEVNPCEPESLERYWEMQRWMPSELIEQAITYGDAAEITHHCQRYIDQGATHLQMYFGSPDAFGSYIVFAHQVMPKLTGRPPTVLASLLGTALGPAIRSGFIKRRLGAPMTRMRPKS